MCGDLNVPMRKKPAAVSSSPDGGELGGNSGIVPDTSQVSVLTVIRSDLILTGDDFLIMCRIRI
jgi:hypothetical protein